jgi:hypothetical protein
MEHVPTPQVEQVHRIFESLDWVAIQNLRTKFEDTKLNTSLIAYRTAVFKPRSFGHETDPGIPSANSKTTFCLGNCFTTLVLYGKGRTCWNLLLEQTEPNLSILVCQCPVLWRSHFPS